MSFAETSADADESSVLWGVGAVSQRLGIATPTLRTWDNRYGLGPSARTEGGHRRYSELDVARVARMSQLIAEGVPPSQAALVSQRSVHDPDAVLSRHALPLDDSALSGRGVALTINTMARAARDLDSAQLAKMLAQVFDRRGVLTGWTEVVAPLMIGLGEAWARGDMGVEAEHLASECVLTELRHRVRYRTGRRPVTASVLLASAADDQHSLPVIALAAALTERRINIKVLGGRTPTVALAAAIEQVAPRVVFLWSSLQATGHVPRLASAVGPDARLTLLLGGPGWGRLQLQPEPPIQFERVSDLASAVDGITSVVG
jgi:DNA-binding transcriptional MerR regulator